MIHKYRNLKLEANSKRRLEQNPVQIQCAKSTGHMPLGTDSFTAPCKQHYKCHMELCAYCYLYTCVQEPMTEEDRVALDTLLHSKL